MQMRGVLINNGTVQLEIQEYIEELRVIGYLDPPDLQESLSGEEKDGIDEYIDCVTEIKAKGE